MKVKTILVAAAITAASTLSAYAECAFHKQQAMSCAEGTAYDAETQTCIPITTS